MPEKAANICRRFAAMQLRSSYSFYAAAARVRIAHHEIADLFAKDMVGTALKK